jgi:outer membrane protein assembly factor BamB
MSTSSSSRIFWLRWGSLGFLLLAPVLCWLVYYWWNRADLDPGQIFRIGVVSFWTTLACLVGLFVWFFGFSGLKAKGKLIGLGVLVLLAGAGWGAIDGLVLDGQLIPRPRFRWQPRPQDQLARYLETQTDPDGLPRIDLTVDPINDFPRYRGFLGDGVVRPTELLDMKWEKSKPKELWRHPCGGGFAGFVVAGNVAITVEQRDRDEVVVCYDRASGKQRWTHDYPASFKHPTGSGPRATPTIADGEVYSLGALGDLVCLEGATGTLRWSVNILTDCKAKSVAWAMTSSPLVVADLVIVNAGIDPNKNASQALVAYHRKDGTRAWAVGDKRAGYSSPQVATLAGRRQVLLFDAGGLGGYDLRTGEQLWQYAWETWEDMNIIQPLVIDDNRVFISSETTNGCAMLEITRAGSEFTVKAVWSNKYLGAKYANPVRMGNSIYGLSNGWLVCLDVNTGERRWRGKWYGQGQMLGVAGTLLIQSESGELVLVPADPKSYREIDRLRVFDAPRTWNTPALAGRQLFLRNDIEMVCYELPLRE